MKIFLASIVSIIFTTSAFSSEQLPHHHCEHVYEFCQQGIRIADYHLHIYNHMNPTNYSHGYWDGQRDAYISVENFIKLQDNR